jgi:hypothetical protein
MVALAGRTERGVATQQARDFPFHCIRRKVKRAKGAISGRAVNGIRFRAGKNECGDVQRLPEPGHWHGRSQANHRELFGTGWPELARRGPPARPRHRAHTPDHAPVVACLEGQCTRSPGLSSARLPAAADKNPVPRWRPPDGGPPATPSGIPAPSLPVPRQARERSLDAPRRRLNSYQSAAQSTALAFWGRGHGYRGIPMRRGPAGAAPRRPGTAGQKLIVCG